jgi:hypothetical protein
LIPRGLLGSGNPEAERNVEFLDELADITKESSAPWSFDIDGEDNLVRLPKTGDAVQAARELGLEVAAHNGNSVAHIDLFDDVVCEIYSIGLDVPFVHLQRPYTRCIINRRILKAADLLALFAFESQKLNIHLDMMTGHLLLVSLGIDLTHASATRKAVHPMAAQDA